MKQTLLFLAYLCVFVAFAREKSVEVTVANSLGINRKGEMVEISADIVAKKLKTAPNSPIVIYDEQNQEVAYQITHNNLIIFPVSVDSCATARYTIKPGVPATVEKQVFGRQYPERLDDIGWENDKTGYRMYGPAILHRGDKLYGYDIFTKCVPHLVMEHRYALELNSEIRQHIKDLRKAGKKDEADSLALAISYHIDHGTGMDCYDVGATLGAGMAVLLNSDNQFVYPTPYVSYEILDNGPLRFTVKLIFEPQSVNADSNVVETRYIQLDKGSWLNKTTVGFEHLSDATPIAAGIVIHVQNPSEYALDAHNGYLTYADLTDNAHNGNGVIYVGVVFPEALKSALFQPFEEKKGSAIGHILGISDYKPNSMFTYYWGAGWSKAGIPSFEAWNRNMADAAAQVRTPLVVKIK
ncbi:MAG: DUF4861 domain-containing protein [Muribaculaceae bacterium]